MIDILSKYKFLIITLMYSIMLLLFFHNYENTRSMIEKNNNIEKAIVEQNILESFKYADNSYKILEKYLNQEMEIYSQTMVELYNENPNIYSWDLEKLKVRFNGYDIYILNENLEIIRTTFEKDLGLNFNQFPSFAQLLRERMAGDDFHADRMDISTNDPKLKKYCYMPTPDNKYLLELSVDILETHPMMNDLNIFANAEHLTKNYDLVKKISFYKFNGTGSEVGIVTKREGSYVDTEIPRDTKDIVKNVVLSNQSIEISVNNSTADNYTNKYIPYLNYIGNSELDWWNSYVVGLTYDDTILQHQLAVERNLFFGRIAIITLVFILFTVAMVYLLKRTEFVASCDSLTTLPNRRVFGEYFNKMIKQRKINKLAILFIDLDNFKTINDTYDHETGDMVLRKVAETLKKNLRKDDMVIRAGGDEFLVLLSGIKSIEDARAAANKIIQELKVPFVINDNKIDVSASIGVSIYPDNGSTLQELTHTADNAMFKAKDRNRDKCILFKKSKGGPRGCPR